MYVDTSSKSQRKPKGQSRMDNPKIQATLDKKTQDENKQNAKTKHRNLKRLATQTHLKPR